MAGVWLPGVTRAPISGPRLWMRPLTGRRHKRPVTKLLWHTTEGSTIAGAVGEYVRRAGTINGVHPHITADPARQKLVQHISLDKSSYSLMDWNDRRGVIQVELVGKAAEVDNWPAAWWQWIGETIAALIAAAYPAIDLTRYPTFYGIGDGIILASAASPIRLTQDEFDAWVGQIGHQDAPAPDSHWDPGRIRADLIAEAANASIPRPSGDDMLYILKAGYLTFYWLSTGGGWSAVTAETGDRFVKAGHPHFEMTAAEADGLRARLARAGRLDESTAPWTVLQTTAAGIDGPYGDTTQPPPAPSVTLPPFPDPPTVFTGTIKIEAQP